jgi:uncharacterized membrane protein
VSQLSGVVHRNIRALLRVREEGQRHRLPAERIADTITRFSGSMPFVYLHACLFGGWIVYNSLPVPRFDPYPFVMLAMFASVEAIFLSTFVLISQNRMSQMNERRAELDLQINLLAEHELTRLLGLTQAMARKLEVEEAQDEDLEELKRDVEPEKVLQTIEETQQPDD